MSTISVVVFDDNKPRRELLQLLINSTEGMVCNGGFEDCRDILKKLVDLMPDVVLMDIDMPHVNGIEGLKIIRKQFPQIKVLMQTVFEDEEKIFDAICAGADGYVLKKTTPDKLLEAIRDVHAGGAPMTPAVAKHVLQLFNHRHNKTLRNNFDLTTREQEILTLLVQGLSYKMIAKQCNISYPTVNTHISHIYEKLHVSSAVEAVTKAMNEGLV